MQPNTDLTAPTLDDSTLDLIYGMKMRGQARPPEITPEAWDSVVISQTNSMSFIASDYRRKLAIAAAAKLEAPLPADDKSKITALHDIALDQLVGVLVDAKTKDSVKLAAAQYVIDHNVGKAKQEIEHSGSLALEIRAQARKALELERLGSRDVTPKENVDKAVQAVDAFLVKHGDESFTVGKRGTDDDSI